MCTSVILFRKKHNWPLIIGSNRDEALSRKSKFPRRHWPNLYPQIIGGLDVKERGTWIALNDHGLVCIIHNRQLEKDNKLIKKSRGQIILNLLNFDNIQVALEYLQMLNLEHYNGFNIILASSTYCYWGKHISVEKKIKIKELDEGISVITDKDLNDLMDKKTNYYLNKFSQSSIPDPSKKNWLTWELLLSTKTIKDQTKPEEAICFINKKINYGTRSGSLIAISNNFSNKQTRYPIIFRSTKKSPSKSSFIDVELGLNH